MSPPLTPPLEPRHIRRPKMVNPFWGHRYYTIATKNVTFGATNLRNSYAIELKT